MSRRGRLRRWLLWLPLGLLLVVLVLPLGLAALLASEAGTAWLLRQAAGLARPHGVELAFAQSRGNLLGRLELSELHLRAADTVVGARRLVLQWRPAALLDRRLHVELLQLDALSLTPPPGGEPEREPAPLELPDLRLPLRIQIDRLELARATVVQPGQPIEIDELGLEAVLDEQGLAIGDLSLAGMGARLDGMIRVKTVTPHDLDGRLAAQIDASLTGEEIGPVEARATVAGTALRPRFALGLEAPARLKLDGMLELDRPAPTFDLAADWSELAWPLRGEPEVTTRDGRLELKGQADDYRLTLRSGLRVPEMPPARLELEGRGDLQALTLEPLRLSVGEGSLRADGEVRWAPAIRWRLALLAEHLDPGLFHPDWPGEVGGQLNVEGGLGTAGDGALAARVRIEELGGRLRGYPVGARGALDWQAGRLTAEALRLFSGPNRLHLDGRADERLDLAFELDAPDLGALYPALAGSLQGTGRLSGTPQVPGVVGRLSGSTLAYQDLRVQALGLEIDWQGTGGQGRLNAAGINAAGTLLEAVEARIDGSPEAHRLDLAAEGPDGRVSLAAQGGLRDRVWQGALRDLTLVPMDLGEWRLQEPTDLLLGAERANAGRLCLVQQETALCAQGGWDGRKGLDLNGRLSGLDLARFAERLPGEAIVEGSLAAEFSAKGAPDNPSVVLDVRPSDGRIRLEEGAEPFDLSFRNARIKGRFADDRGSAELQFELGPNGRAAGQVSLGAETGGGRPLAGDLKAEFPDLSLVAGFVPALDEVQGRLQLAARLAGTLSAPRLAGGLRLSDARARVPAAGVLLTDIDLELRGDGAAPIRVDGRVQSGEGRITLDGSVDPTASGGPAVDLAIRGADFEAARLPEALVMVSPDLRLKGNGPYHLSGQLRIPRAAIELKEIPSGTVSVSDDEIVAGEAPPQPPQAGRNLTAGVRVELGDSVTFKGFGLSTGLTGALDATVDQRGTVVDGKIELRDGKYKAYGQDLTVEQGRLLFAGPPGNPDVDLRALRVSSDGAVKAYLAMSGPLSKPRPRVYSEPALPEAEALAYLLTGRGLDQAGQQEGSAIASAALSLGLSKGEPLLQDMSQRLGLDELRIDSGAGGLADSSLILGKYLNPDLYLGYSQGLFSPEGAVLLRLRLSERLEVESRSGTEQSVDLFYKIEHN